MKHFSVRVKLTLWMIALMTVLVCVVSGLLFEMSSRVTLQSAQQQLMTFVRENLTSISKQGDTLQFSDGVQFSRNGMYLLIYNEAGALLAGQTPLLFPAAVPFSNGFMRSVTDTDDSGVYLVVDFWLPFSWEDGVWVRGIVQQPELNDAMHRLLDVSLLLLPMVVLLSGVGVYAIVRRAFGPIDRIAAAASEIGQGRDLSRRIGLPPGKDEISRMATAFDQMFARLESAFEAESRFTSDASHELRTPTAVILAQCREAEQHAQTVEEYAAAIAVIHRQADRISRLTGQLLQMTRLEQGTVPLCLEQADLSALVEVVCQEQQDLWTDKTICATVGEEVMAQFDVTLMTRVLQNLLENACRYGGTHITVQVEQTQEQVVLSVFDDGPGIPLEQQDKIWKRFYRVESARSDGQGTGLGLPMVAQIVQLHGGTITLNSGVAYGGTVFTVRIPSRQE